MASLQVPENPKETFARSSFGSFSGRGSDDQPDHRKMPFELLVPSSEKWSRSPFHVDFFWVLVLPHHDRPSIASWTYSPPPSLPLSPHMMYIKGLEGFLPWMVWFSMARMKIGASLGSPVIRHRLPLLRCRWLSTLGATMACPSERDKCFTRRFCEEENSKKERLGILI